MTQDYMFTGPMARKKKTDCYFDLNSYRVISDSAQNIPPVDRYRTVSSGPTLPSSNILGQPKPVVVRPESEHRHNCPHPKGVNFLRHDVRILNEPVCNVDTKSTASEQHLWWPHRTPTTEAKQPGHPNDTIVRDDFQYRGTGIRACGRYSSRDNKNFARGIVPVTMMKQENTMPRLYQEDISFEHQYDSRKDPNYPIRAKRHGAFVYGRVPEEREQKLLAHYAASTQPSQMSSSESQIDVVKSESNATTVSQSVDAPKQQQQHTADSNLCGPSSMPAVAV